MAEEPADPSEIFQLIERLGEGSYGEVYNALDTRETPPRVVAIKLVPLDGDSVEEFRGEIDILSRCHSPYIVNYLDSFTKDNELWIVMEYCGAGSVNDLISICHVTLTEPEIADVCASMLLGLQYLHKEHLIHRDVKAGNVLLSPEGNAKLADFGVSAQLNNTMSRRRTVIGTPFWMAPEVIQETSYDGKADIWSLGITIIEMAEGEPPNSHIHPMRAIFLIPTLPPPKLADAAKWSPHMVDFVSQCLKKDPAERPTAQELLKHPFVVHNAAALMRREGVSPVLSELVDKHMPTITEWRDNQYGDGAGDGEAFGDTMVRSDAVDDAGGGAGGATIVRRGPRSSLARGGSGRVRSGSGSLGGHSDTGTMVRHGTVEATGTVVVNGGDTATGTMVHHAGADGAGDEPTFMRYFREAQAEEMKGDSESNDPGPPPVPAPVVGAEAEGEGSLDGVPLEELRSRLERLDTDFEAARTLYERRRGVLRAAISALGEGEYV